MTKTRLCKLVQMGNCHIETRYFCDTDLKCEPFFVVKILLGDKLSGSHSTIVNDDEYLTSNLRSAEFAYYCLANDINHLMEDDAS